MTATVNLRVYDISGGAAKRWSPILLGRQIQGVWHSGVEVFGFEYFYGGGIVKMKPENVEMTFGISPNCVHCLGATSMNRLEFERFLISVMPMFKREVYNLTDWNCNHFANYCSRELVRKDIPAYILDLPEEVGRTFIGKLLLNFLKMISGGTGGSAPVAVPINNSRAGRKNGAGEMQSAAAVRSQSDKVERLSRCRRNSCPSVIPEPPVSNIRLPKLGSACIDREGAGGEAANALQRVPGSPIQGKRGEEIPTEILLSPMHKRLYEVERNLYLSTAPGGVPARRDQNNKVSRMRRSSVCG